MELNTIGEFQKIADESHTPYELRRIMHHKNFFHSPKDTDPIKRQHSAMIDRLLGFDIKSVEDHLVKEARSKNPGGRYETLGPKLHDGTQSWIGLDPQTLQTTYQDLLDLLKIVKIKEGEILVDLGAAYGRIGILMNILYPRSQFIGYEVASKRVEEGNRVYDNLKISNAKLYAIDLSDKNFALPKAEIFFMYDYGRLDHIEETLKQLEILAKEKPLKILVRGKMTLQILKKKFKWEILADISDVCTLFKVNDDLSL